MEGIGSLKQQAQALLEQTVSELQQTLGAKTRLRFRIDDLPLEAHALAVQEGLNQVSRWQVHCAAAHTLDTRALLGKSAEITLIGGDGLSRTQQGVITAVDYHDDLPDAGQGHFVFHLQSNLARLAQRQRWRLVQQQRVVDAITTLLAEYHLEIDNRLTQDYPAHSWLLQAGETDLAWLQRLLAEEGISFYSRHGEHGETLVLFDQPSAVDRADRGAIAVVADSGAVRQLGQQSSGALTEVRAWYQQMPERVEVHIQGNPSEGHPKVIAVGKPPAPQVLTETLYLRGHPDAAEARRRATLRLEYCQANRHGLSAQGPVADLAPGQWLEVQGVGPCLIVSAALHYGEPDDHRGNAPRALHWQAELKPLNRPWRPAVPARPDLPEVFPAQVEATSAYAELDGAGRRRARLHLDQDDSASAQASPPLRQLQPHSGPAAKNGQPSGWDWPLRQGTQVLVSLLNNDFSQPYILGYLPASDQPGPASNRNPSQYRLLTPAGNHLSLDDHKRAEAITLHSPEGHCVMTFDANPDNTHVLLACQQGGLLLRSGGDQHVEVGQSSATRVGASQQSQIGRDLHWQSRGAVLHHQSATDMTLLANQQLNLQSGRNMEASTGKTLVTRAEANADIQVGRDLLMKLGGSLHVQADQDLIIEGNGRADITVHQNGGGFTIKPDGRIRLFGNTVNIKGRQGTGFNGDMKWNIPAAMKADSPAPGTPASPRTVPDLDLDPDWCSAESSPQLLAVNWQQDQVQLGEPATARVRVRGLLADSVLTCTVIECYGGQEQVLDSWTQPADKAAGDVLIEWSGALPSGEMEVAADSPDEPLQGRSYQLRVAYNGQQQKSEQPLNILSPVRFEPLNEAGDPLPDGSPAMLEDAHGGLHDGVVDDGVLRFPAVPLGQVRLRLNRYDHLEQSEFDQQAESGSAGEGLRNRSRVEVCPHSAEASTVLTCKEARIVDMAIIPGSDEVLLLTQAEVDRIEQLEEKYNAPIVALQQAISAGDKNGVRDARLELETLLRESAVSATASGDDGAPDADGRPPSFAMFELVRPNKQGAKFSFIPSDVLAYHSLEDDRRYTVEGIRDSLAYGTNEIEEEGPSNSDGDEKRVKDFFSNVELKIKTEEIDLIKPVEGQLSSADVARGVAPVLSEFIPDSWFEATDGWIADINEKARFSWTLAERRRNRALEILKQGEEDGEIDDSTLGKAKDDVFSVWSEGEWGPDDSIEQDASLPSWFSEFMGLKIDESPLGRDDYAYWHQTIKDEPLPPEQFRASGGAAFMRYVGGATASAEMDLMKGQISAEVEAKGDLALAKGQMQGDFMLPNDRGWQAGFPVIRREDRVEWVPQAYSGLNNTLGFGTGTFPTPSFLRQLNQHLGAIQQATQLEPTALRLKVIGQDAAGGYCATRTKAVDCFLRGDVNGWLSLFSDGIWGEAEKQQMRQAVGIGGAANWMLATLPNLAYRLGVDDQELVSLVIRYMARHRDPQYANVRLHSYVGGYFHGCSPPNSLEYCQAAGASLGSGSVQLKLFRMVEHRREPVESQAQLGYFRCKLSASLTGYAGANLVASAKVYVNPNQGKLEVFGLAEGADEPDEVSRSMGMIDSERVDAPLDNVPVHEGSPFATRADDNQGANVTVGGFAGAKFTAGIKGLLEWQPPSEAFKPLGTVGYQATGMAGIGAGLAFQVGFDERSGRFVIHCKAELALKVGVGGGFSFSVDAHHIRDFLLLLYNELRDAEFNIIDVFDSEGEAFEAFCAFQYELFKRGGAAGLAVGAATAGTLLTISAVQGVFNFRQELLDRWYLRDHDSQAAHELAETLNGDGAGELLALAFPETKGRLLDTLVSAPRSRRDFNWFSGGMDERREEAALVVLDSIQHPREYQEVMEHMGVNIPVGDSVGSKYVRALDNELRLLDFLDGRERRAYEELLETRFAS